MKAQEINPPGAFALGLLLLPFYINDAANILIQDTEVWMACDYATRVAILALAGAFVRKHFVLWHSTCPIGHSALRELFGWPRVGVMGGAGWTIATTAVALIIIVGPGRSLLGLWPETQVAWLPVISAPGWRMVDLSLGLALVAISEEVVFRGIVMPTFADAFQSRLVALVLSSVLFGAAHWSLGVGAILQTGLAGMALGICTLGCRSVYPAIIAHYAVDLVAFA